MTWNLFINMFLLGPLHLWQASSIGERERRKWGEDMQPLAKGGIKPLVSTKDHGACSKWAIERPDMGHISEIDSPFSVGLGQLFCSALPCFRMRNTDGYCPSYGSSEHWLDWLINSILNCGEKYLRENTNTFAYLHRGTFRIVIARAKGLQVKHIR